MVDGISRILSAFFAAAPPFALAAAMAVVLRWPRLRGRGFVTTALALGVLGDALRWSGVGGSFSWVASMIAVLPTTLLGVLLAIGLYRMGIAVRRRDDAPETWPQTQDAALPIGGWLLVPAIALLLAALAGGLAIMFWSSAVINAFNAERPWAGFELERTAVPETVLHTAFLTWTMLAFFGRRRAAPALMIALLLLSVCTSVVAASKGSPLLLHMELEESEQRAAAAYGVFGSIVGAAIWVPYFRWSRRVGRTFVK